jgi:TPR repeat protein
VRSDALAKLRERAEAGEAEAQYQLGLRLLHGVGVDTDYTEAERWLRLAAEHHLLGAQFCLGYMYDEGKGLPRDAQEAARWYEAAASGGDSDAQHNLALLKWHGAGVRKDRRAALELMDRALADPADFTTAVWGVLRRVGTWVLTFVAIVMLMRLACSEL